MYVYVAVGIVSLPIINYNKKIENKLLRHEIIIIKLIL